MHSRSCVRKSSLVRAGKLVWVDCIALSPIQKVSSYFLVSDEHIKVRLDQSSFYGLFFIFTTSDGDHITVLLLCHLSKIIDFNCNDLFFDLLILNTIFTYWDIITLRNELIFVNIDTYLFLNPVIGFIL